MNLHEYQAKQFLKQYGIKIPEGHLAGNMDETKELIDEYYPDGHVVLKAQIHSGGRGKAGGVLLCDDREDALKKAASLFGKTLVTRQTGPKGKLVRRIYLETPSAIDREMYLSLLIDTDSARHPCVACHEGGTSIEELAESDPDAIVKIAIEPSVGLREEEIKTIASALELNDTKQIGTILSSMYEMFRKENCTLIEINPLALSDGKLIALDAKVTLDSDVPQSLDYQDPEEEDPLELKASKYGMNYVSLDGNIGCICNGAGLGMSTVDTVCYYGGRPANFLDTGGTISEEKAFQAFEIVSHAPNVKGVLVNIFGGIARCDLIANGIVESMKGSGYPGPVVVRIEGNSAETAHEILLASHLPIVFAENCSDAVKKMLELLEGERR